MARGPQGVDRYLSSRARNDIAEAIEDAEGNEVFFLGLVGDDGLVDEVEVHCRGHKSAVPALKQIGRSGDVVIHNHPSGRLIPSEPDLALAAHYGQEGIGFFIVDNEASAVYVVVEPQRDRSQVLDPDAVQAAMTGVGALPDLLPGYEPREGQVTMARRVAEGQNEGRISIIEAGTGTGKSLAYLLPSVMRSVGGGQRVVVSTRTRHLQQQLVTHDVPIVRKLQPDLRVAILKGRGNYLCRRKLGDRLKEENADAAEREFLEQVRDWSAATREGDIDDLPFVPDRELWELVQSSTEHTLRVRCPHYEECFYYSSRRRAAKANLLVVNHHLLLADMALRRDGVAGGLLPRYDHVILDEAHHLEDVATDFAGRDVTTLGLLRQLGRLRPVRGRRAGLLVRLRKAVDEAGTEEAAVDLRRALDEALEAVEATRASLRLQLEDISWNVLEAAGPAPPRSQRGRRQSRTWRLPDDLETSSPMLYELLAGRLDEAVQGLSRTARATEIVRDTLDQMGKSFRGAHLQVGMDLATVQRRLVESASTLGTVLKASPDLVRWVDVRFSQDDVPQPRFVVRPIEVAGVVQDVVVPAAKSLTLTSATLSVAGGFDHYLGRTGLGQGELFNRVHTEQIPSPFDYGKQVYVGVPDDLPEPSDPRYLNGVVEAVTEAIRIAEGRTFVLFTSYRMLHQVADQVGRRLGREYSILRQGELPRERLLEVFKAGRRAALFGTDSFWEGVDVRGAALSCVILPKLPFRVPSEPIQVARAERISARGGDPFREMAVPQAVLKFRQGFGRLVRHRTDRGVVLLLDVRVLRKSYGRSFFASLPEGVRPVKKPLQGVLEGMAQFLGQGE